MGRLSKNLIKLGMTPINSILLIVTLVLVALVLVWQQSGQSKRQEAQRQHYQQQIFDGVTQQLSSALAEWQHQVTTIASQAAEDVSRLSAYELGLWQQEQLSHHADIERLCVVSEVPSAPQENACLPITFASLEQLRQLKNTGDFQSVYIQAGEHSHLLMLANMGEQPNNAILMAAISMDTLKSKVVNNFTNGAYVEVVQGSGNVLPILKFGDSQIKQGPAEYQKQIRGSSLKVNYWFPPVASELNLLVLLIVAVVILMGWLLQQLCLRLFLRHDAECICQQISDYEDLALKPSYPLALRAFYSVSDAIHRLAALSGKKKGDASPKQRPAPVILNEQEESTESQSVANESSSLKDSLRESFRAAESASGIEVEELDSVESSAGELTNTSELSEDITVSKPKNKSVSVDEEESFNPDQTMTLEQVEASPSEIEVSENEPLQFSTATESEQLEDELLKPDSMENDDSLLDFSLSETDREQDRIESPIPEEVEKSKPEIDSTDDDMTLNFVSPEPVDEPKSELENKEKDASKSASDVPDALLKLWDKKD